MRSSEGRFSPYLSVMTGWRNFDMRKKLRRNEENHEYSAGR